LLLNPIAASRLVDAGVDRNVRGEDGASDHAPAWIQFGPAAKVRSPRRTRQRAEATGLAGAKVPHIGRPYPAMISRPAPAGQQGTTSHVITPAGDHLRSRHDDPSARKILKPCQFSQRSTSGEWISRTSSAPIFDGRLGRVSLLLAPDQERLPILREQIKNYLLVPTSLPGSNAKLGFKICRKCDRI
jgi:hypothetical protein